MKSSTIAVCGALLMSGGLAHAGGAESGGGGNAVVCRNLDGTIRSAELLDLYEARVRFGLNVPKHGLSLREEFLRARNRGDLAQGLHPTSAELEHEIQEFEAKIHYLLGDETLGEIADSNPTVVPKNCKIERLAFYDDRFNSVEIVREIWDRLSTTDQAALYTHELLYAAFRRSTQGQELDSTRTRYYVAYLFSDLPLDAVDGGIPSDHSVIQSCVFSEVSANAMDDGRFVRVLIYPGSNAFVPYLTEPLPALPGLPEVVPLTGTTVQFQDIDSVPIYSRKTAFLGIGESAYSGGVDLGGDSDYVHRSQVGRTLSQMAPGDQVQLEWKMVHGKINYTALNLIQSFTPYEEHRLAVMGCSSYGDR